MFRRVMCVRGKNPKMNYYLRLLAKMATKLVKVPVKASGCNRNWSSPRSLPVVLPIIISKSIWSTPPPPQEEPNCNSCIENIRTTLRADTLTFRTKKEEERMESNQVTVL